MMKKYIKPQIDIKELEIIDVITVSGGLFGGLADIDEAESVEWDDKILDPKDTF